MVLAIRAEHGEHAVGSNMDRIEQRTHALGRQLLQAVHQHSPSLPNALHDQGLLLLAHDETLRNNALRFIDVLSDLRPGRDDARLRQIAREYLGPVTGALPGPVSAALDAALWGPIPDSLFARSTRAVVEQIANRFIVPGGPEGTRRLLDHLRAQGRFASFDVLGEAVVGERAASTHTQQYLDVISRLANDIDAGRNTSGGVRRLQISIKLSALTADFNPLDPRGTLRRLQQPLERILDAARAAGVAVTWDMEQYSLRDLTWWLFQEVFQKGTLWGDWDGAGLVLQAYLRDSGRFADDVIAFARQRGVPFQVRLVKGAYWDFETITAEANHWPISVFAQKWQTDTQYEHLTRALLEAHPHVRLAVASHNLRSLAHAEAARETLDLPEGTVEYQTLYGMAPAISGALSTLGWVARDYVPIGDLISGMAYLVRRVLENTSQVGFLLQSRTGTDPEALLVTPRPDDRRPTADDRGKGPSSEDRGARDSPELRLIHGGATGSADGFVPVAPVRLFEEEERERFARALAQTRARWGQNVPLTIGATTVATEERLVSWSPTDGREVPVATVRAADHQATEHAIRVANEGLQGWSERPRRERAAILRRAADLLLQERHEMAAWVLHEGGKHWSGALADVDEAIDFLRYYSAQVKHLPHDCRPRGVVAVIPPWNFPVAIPCGMASAALVAGNTVILKSAEQTPYVAHRLVEILHRGGVPKDALIHLPGTGETVGRALVASPDVDMVAFTGSREVGTEISRIAAGVELTRGGIKHVVAEMGGKNPIVVFADADLEEAALAILSSAFGHAGQKCSAASRVLVERSIHRELADLLVEGARSMALGPASEPGTAINPVIDDIAAARVREWVSVARREGASLLDHQEKAQAGTLLGPVVVSLEGSRAGDARIAREEIFGPVLALLPFDTTEEAITVANSTEYALTAGVFSRSPARVRQMVQGLRAGNVYVNREITGARVGIEPFGGWGLSGTGPKAGGPEYLHAFITRRDYPDSGQTAEMQDAPAVLAETPIHLAPVQGEIGVIPWSVSPIERAEVIMRLLTLLSEERSDVQQALTTARAIDERTPAQWIAELRALGASLAGRITEITITEPTMPVPGQHTYTRWDEPRGSGLITVDESASPAELLALMFGGLLAGNGIVVTASPSLAQVAMAFTRLLHRAGVPSSSLRYQANGSATAWLAVSCRLAAEPIAFAGISVREETARRLAQVLAAPWPEQRWLKAMISVTDGPLPWEDGFLRRFALPKTVAIRTLRHGADLVFV